MQPLDGRLDDAGAYLLHEAFVSEGYGADATHAASVEALVALANTLVVFGYGEYFVVGAVSQYEDGAFYTAEKLLDNNGGAGAAKHAAQHLLKLALCLL